jgi:serine/threonine-protein kinase
MLVSIHIFLKLRAKTDTWQGNLPGRGHCAIEFESMPITDPTKSTEDSESRLSLSEPADGGKSVSIAPDSPTVVRASSSGGRQSQVGSEASAGALPRPGVMIGTFLLEEAIGAGGMGAVFRALDAQLDRQVALKLLPLDQTGDPEIVQRFYQEGKSAARLDHENIARVYSIGQDGPNHYIAFEYIDGITVRRRVEENGTLPVEEAVDITLQIAQALVHAAARGVVHRDIKPSNIVLTPRGRAKLVDMGLARRFEREVDHGLTQSGMTLGTFDYISPEQARDPRDVDVRSDLYSLGCTLFQMLTGRPPFPGGTVLQKLLQHQEEPPPEIRGLNPAVPVELARIITKLMAKDRDRRYQSPEQLVRDLLSIAGRLGLAATTTEAHAWMTAGHRVTWERHLVWFFPALAFLVVVAGLVWWGRESNPPVPSELGGPLLRPPRNEPGLKEWSSPPTDLAEDTSSVEDAHLASSASVSVLPRNVIVRPSDDLQSAIASAPPRSIITLTEDGPYLLAGRTGGTSGPLALVNRDLTIKPDAGVHPVLRFTADAHLRGLRFPALLPFSGGNVTIEGLTFELDREGADERVSAISAEDTVLTIRNCLFRQSAVRTGRNRTALRILARKTIPLDGVRPPALSVNTCHIDGGQVAIFAEGPADIILHDCTIGPGSPSIWLDNSKTTSPVPAEIHLRHSSFMTGAGPIFDITGTQARILVDDCVIAPAASLLPTLVVIDSARNLVWRGRHNLYGRMRSYLEPTQKGEGAGPIDDFGQWTDTLGEVREVDTSLADTTVWISPEPLQDLILQQDNPTQPFQLATRFLNISPFGARQGPFNSSLADPTRRAGTLDESGQVVVASETVRAGEPNDGSAAVSAGAISSQVMGKSTLAANQPRSVGDVPKPMPGNAADEDEDASSLSNMQPMSMPPPDTGHSPGGGTEPVQVAAQPSVIERPTPSSGNRLLDQPMPTTGPTELAGSQEDLIRSTEQFVYHLNRLGSKGGTLRLASGGELELPTTEFAGSTQWLIRAEPGTRRPRIRFRPSAYTARPTPGWSVLFNVRSDTSLQLQGLDLMIPDQDPEVPHDGRQAVIGVSAGSGLTLDDCTITADGRPSTTAAIVIQSGTSDEISAAADRLIKRARVDIRDCFVRTGGDCVSVASGRLLDLQLRNVLIAADGSLLHALGSTQIERSKTAITVKIDHSLARTRGGLVYLESTMEETELPLTDIQTTSSTFSTAGPGPLFRVDGQGQLERLHDRIVWKAEKVAYDEITTYRRDQILQTGVSPVDYTRSDWTNAFDPKDESPLTESVRFRKKLEPWKSSASLSSDDLMLDPNGPATGRGPDVGRIPAAPPGDS